MPDSMQAVCDRIVLFESSVRFSGMASGSGKTEASHYRKGIVPLLTKKNPSCP